VPTLKELEKWLSTSQAASELSKSRQGVLWLVENGHLRGVKTAIGWHIDPRAVEAYKDRAATSRW
jgi:orotate phosphoribosyltransferase-like protein